MLRRVLCILIAVSLLPVGAAVCVGGLLAEDCECGTLASCGQDCDCAGEPGSLAAAEQHPAGRTDWSSVALPLASLAIFEIPRGDAFNVFVALQAPAPRPPTADRPFPDSDLPLLI